MPTPPLTDATLLGTTASLPGYDRSRVTTGIVHLGLGNFARAHLCTYVDDLLAAGVTDLGIVGVSLRSPDVAAALRPQDCLYTVGVVDGTHIEPRVVGAVTDTLVAGRDSEAIRTHLGSEHVRIVTVTVTEKGYCSDPTGRGLDLEHPDVRHDMTHPEHPVSLIGWLSLMARVRRANGAGPVTVLSLDNIRGNGRVLRSAVHTLAAVTDPSLSRWIDDNVRFPCSMVDRMVPATDDDFRHRIEEVIGRTDHWPVRAEPYRQWIVERDWASAPPPLDTVDVTFVDDVSEWEDLKLRVLNALHTCAALFGVRHGLDTVDAVVSDPAGRALLDRMAAEVESVVEAPSGLRVVDYIASVLGRFANSALQHRCRQIATDTSQKLPQRILPTLRDRLQADLPIDALATTIALWAWTARGATPDGRSLDIPDPLSAELRKIAGRSGDDPRRLAEGVLALESVFGELSGDERLVAPVAAELARLL